MKTVLATDSSYEALLFLEWFAKTSPLLVNVYGERQPLYTAYNGGEKHVRNWRIDGYCPDVDGRPLFVEFQGCHWHGCSFCGTLAADDDDDEQWAKRVKSERQKHAHLKTLGRLVTQRECLWRIEASTIPYFETDMPRVWNRTETHDQLINAIKTDQVFGFAKCQVKSPPSLTEAYRTRGFFYPIIPTKIKLEPEYYAKPPPDLPPDPVLTQIFNTIEPILLLSSVLQFYLELGCEIKIDYFIQFKGEKCFAPFVHRVTKLRMDAKSEGNDTKNLTSKLTGNSSYGKTLENPSRYTKCTITSDNATAQKRISSPFFISLRDLTTDPEHEIVEINWRAEKIFDDKPIQVGQCILQMAKLLLLKFVMFIDDHLQPGSFQLTYSDTDSIGMAMCDTDLTAYRAATNLEEKIDAIFGPVIKPDKFCSWEEQYRNWFVHNESVQNQLKPGLLKCKFKTKIKINKKLNLFKRVETLLHFRQSRTLPTMVQEMSNNHKKVCQVEHKANCSSTSTVSTKMKWFTLILANF